MQVSQRWLAIFALTLIITFIGSGATMGTSSYLHANLGWLPFNSYSTTSLAANSGFGGTVNGTYYSSCPSGASVEGCFQTILSQLRAQGVTGVRIFIPLCDAFPTCGSSASWNPGQNQAQLTWITNVGNFFQDVKTAGIQNVTITVTNSGPNMSVPASQTWSPAVPGGNCSVCGNCTSDAGTNVIFDPIVPYGMSDGTAGACGSQYKGAQGLPLGDYWATHQNNGYNYAPVNNQNFIGWSNYFNVINAVLQRAGAVVNVYGLEIAQELAPGTFTALARYFYDNSSPGTAPPQYVQTVNGHSYVNVFAALRSLMTSNGFDPGRVFYSAAWEDPTAAAQNCGNLYQDYARATDLDEITQTINAGPIGMSSSMNVTDGLPCGGTIDSGLFYPPIYSSQPDIVDAHIYPHVEGSVNTDAMIQQAAAIDYGDVPHFLSGAGLTSATIVIGETWGGNLSPLYLGAANGGYCWSTGNSGNDQTPPGAPSDNVAGFNAEGVSSPLSNYTVTIRPWMNLEWLAGACFNYGSGPGSSNNYQTINYNGQGPYTPTHQ